MNGALPRGTGRLLPAGPVSTWIADALTAAPKATQRDLGSLQLEENFEIPCPAAVKLEFCYLELTGNHIRLLTHRL